MGEVTAWGSGKRGGDRASEEEEGEEGGRGEGSFHAEWVMEEARRVGSGEGGELIEGRQANRWGGGDLGDDRRVAGGELGERE